MLFTKDKCPICLDEKVHLATNDYTYCGNDECSAYICKSCWKDLVLNDTTTCPICRQHLNRYDLESNSIIPEPLQPLSKQKYILYATCTYLFMTLLGFSSILLITGLITGQPFNETLADIYTFNFIKSAVLLSTATVIGTILVLFWMLVIKFIKKRLNN